ncbi:DNA replication/repair protein RecF [Enteractinococcus fodinae]|uniref:DNA replication and repair protein RecF n=1 Tax=Enteractinococcus fodinae TaxID=684663 RepID=A0ABU2AYW9_9MICC|nr:DNA replication/repair protein RecF [Enteractinococcus fodinae]MDR7345753.1 DNA replication and repair protein RecF [Enteractinococcus fodinae]
MYLSHLSLTNYRSYEQAELDLKPGPNILVGANGVGKTNVAEAINYLAVQHSHRVSNDHPLVRIGHEQALARGRVHRGEQAISIEYEINPGKSNRVAINRGAPQPARQAYGIFKAVMFAPEDIELVSGQPDIRRRFMDDLIVQMRPALGDARRDFDRVLRQRNALLKSGRKPGAWTEEHETTLGVWNEHLSRAAARLINGRLHALRLLAIPTANTYAQLSNGNKPAGFSYQSTVPLASGQHAEVPDEAQLYQAVLTELESSYRAERDRGITLVGPHRDDMVITLGPAPAKGFASHGETWSLALALRLASYRVLVEDDPDPNAKPVLILDDVFAELDAARRSRLAEMTRDAEQLIITAAVAADIPAELTGTHIPVQMRDGISSPGEHHTDLATLKVLEANNFEDAEGSESPSERGDDD